MGQIKNIKLHIVTDIKKNGAQRFFQKSRLDQELKLIGEYGLRNKREVWRVKLSLANIRKRARDLLTLPEKDGRRLFEGNALLRRLVRIGVLDEGRMKLDYVLGLKVEDFLERRLQTQVFKLGLAKSIHHARVLIRQRHISTQAVGERTIIHCTIGLTETHRLQHQLSVRRWSCRTCETTKHEERRWW